MPLGDGTGRVNNLDITSSLFALSIGGIPGITTGFAGTLDGDGDGRGNATIQIQPGTPADLRFNFTAVAGEPVAPVGPGDRQHLELLNQLRNWRAVSQERRESIVLTKLNHYGVTHCPDPAWSLGIYRQTCKPEWIPRDSRRKPTQVDDPLSGASRV